MRQNKSLSLFNSSEFFNTVSLTQMFSLAVVFASAIFAKLNRSSELSHFLIFFFSQNHSKFGESAGGVLRFYCERIFFFKIWLSIYTSTYLRSSIERGGKRGRGGVSKIKQGGWGRGPQTSWHNETDMFWDWFRSERGEILRWSSNWKIILKNPENNFKYLFAIQFKCILTKIT
jgi:hypothetical protein